jgi:hypothetical protein
MRIVLAVLLLGALLPGMTAAAAAYDLGNQAPVKPVVTYPENVPNPERQGGDTIALAHVIPSLPYSDSGTTAGYTNDYDAVCPYTGSTSPDVVYRYVAPVTGTWDIDLCGSAYDTKLYVMDAAQAVLACNDDFYIGAPCGVYVSLIENFTFVAGSTYYIVVDGYGAASGTYFLALAGPLPPCDLVCPAGGYFIHEYEPPLVNDYVDNWNGGCNTPGHPFQTIPSPIGQCTIVLCGVSGWYDSGVANRDTDWYLLEMPVASPLEVTVDAEYATYIFDLGPQDCDNVGVFQQVTGGPCAEGHMTITEHGPGEILWIWAGPTNWDAPSLPFEYDYVCWFFGSWGIANEPTTWSTVKVLFQ